MLHSIIIYRNNLYYLIKKSIVFLKLDFIVIRQNAKICFVNIRIVDDLKDVAIALNLLRLLLYYRSTYIILPEIIVPFFFALGLLNRRLSCMVLLKKLAKSPLMTIFNCDCFLIRTDDLLLHFTAFLNFLQLRRVKEL